MRTIPPPSPPPAIAATDRLRRALARLGVHAELTLARVDGALLSDADLVACDAAAIDLDELEALLDRARWAASLTGRMCAA